MSQKIHWLTPRTRHLVGKDEVVITVAEYAKLNHLHPQSCRDRLIKRKVRGFKKSGRWYVIVPKKSVKRQPKK